MQRFLRFAVFVLTAGLAFGGSPKIATDLVNRDSGATVDVIVQFKQTPTETHYAKVRGKGGLERQRLSLVKGGSFSISAGKLEELAADPDVAFISPDRPIQAALDYATPSVGGDLAFQYGWDGNGIGVAIIDSGVADHDDLKGRVVYSESFNSGTSRDQYGHGTHVAGVIAGSGESTGVKPAAVLRGIAPKANLISLKVLDGEGRGSDSGVIAAIQRVIELKDRFNIRVLNLSLGRPVFEPRFPFWPSRHGQRTPIHGLDARSSFSSHDRCSVRSHFGRWMPLDRRVPTRWRAFRRHCSD